MGIFFFHHRFKKKKKNSVGASWASFLKTFYIWIANETGRTQLVFKNTEMIYDEIAESLRRWPPYSTLELCKYSNDEYEHIDIAGRMNDRWMNPTQKSAERQPSPLPNKKKKKKKEE